MLCQDYENWKNFAILYLLCSVIFCIHVLIRGGYYKKIIWHEKKIENYKKKHGITE